MFYGKAVWRCLNQRAWLLVGLIVVGWSTEGCLLGAPDTFGDMNSRLDDLKLPPNATLVQADQSGLRSGFAAAGRPYIVRSYSVAWQNGTTCDDLAAVVPDKHSGSTSEDGSCVFEAWVPSGIRARLVNVWKYKLVVVGRPPEVVANRVADVDCEAERAKEDVPRLYARYHIDCWVQPDSGLVSVILNGKYRGGYTW